MTLLHVRDLEISGGGLIAGRPVELHCIIVKRNKTRTSLFLDVQDETGVLQAVAQSDQFDEHKWSAATSLRLGDAVIVRGETTTSFRSASVACSSIELVENIVPTAQRGRRTMGVGSPVSQAYVARLQRYIRLALEDAGYIEVATRLITSTPPPMPGLYPLKVVYDGFGAPFYITPSPVPQVIQALASTSYKRVFTVSRCFTQGYRDPVVSVESIIATAAARQTHIEALLLWLDQTVRTLLLKPETKSARTIDWPETRTISYESFEGTASAAVDQPEIQLFTGLSAAPQISTLGRLCWPRHPEMHSEFSEHVLAEGYTVGDRRSPAFSVATVNIDRLLTLLFEQAELRRIPALAVNGLEND